MNLTTYSVTAYLVLLLIFGILDIFLSAYLRATSPRRIYARKMFLRCCTWVLLSVSFLALFRGGILGTWTVFLTVGTLVLLNEYLIIWINKVLSTKDIPQSTPTVPETWRVTRTCGKRRFLLISIAVYGFGILWLAILMKIIFLGSFPLYLIPIFMFGGFVWGYLEGAREWKRNERNYLKLKDTGRDA